MALLNSFRSLAQHPLFRQRPLHALARVARWQLSSRLAVGPIAVPFVDAATLLVSRGMTGATGNVYTGLHELEDMGFLLHFLRCEDLFVDVGANVGSYTILASKVVGASSIAIEPVPESFAHLQLNIRLNGIDDRVDARRVAARATRTELAFSIDRDTMNQVVDDSYSGRMLRVPVEPLDRILNGRASTVMKVDVEGFEDSVMQGAEAALAAETLSAVIMECPAGDSMATEALTRNGFVRHQYDPLSRALIRVAAGRSSFGNSLFLRDSRLAAARVASAPRFNLHGWSI